MACRLFGTKTISKSILVYRQLDLKEQTSEKIYRQLDLKEQTSMKIYLIYETFHSRNTSENNIFEMAAIMSRGR